ncbi:hypothetical protein [Microbulbifer sp. TYP-18]|uniref:hypothetical protein n=1 Tax=Microbulbifer sp. TYP-18 TaxID=3230024 RepID=UPI0034C5CDB4
MSELSDTFSSKEYIRVFVKPSEGKGFVKNYLQCFDAELEYAFNMPKLNNLQVIALTSPYGNISAVVTESLNGFPEYLERTKVLYWTRNMNLTLDIASKNGMTILQNKTPVPIGFQGRFETPGGYVVELAEASEEGKKYFNPDAKALGFT